LVHFSIPNDFLDGWVFGGTGKVNQETGHKLQVLGRDEEM
jgi:hypothetical protein